jgi:hypothetical protein
MSGGAVSTFMQCLLSLSHPIVSLSICFSVVILTRR